MQELDYDYQRLKAFLAFYNATYRDMSALPVELRPGPLLERQEEEDPKAAARNVRTEVNRIVDQSFRWSAGKVAELEAALEKNGIVSLVELRKRFSKEYKAIVKRGEIMDLAEYYMAKGLVERAGFSVATKREKELLEEMMAVFEQAELKNLKRK
jgi:hypothetical protein